MLLCAGIPTSNLLPVNWRDLRARPLGEGQTETKSRYPPVLPSITSTGGYLDTGGYLNWGWGPWF